MKKLKYVLLVQILFLFVVLMTGCVEKRNLNDLEYQDLNNTWSYSQNDEFTAIKKKSNDFMFSINTKETKNMEIRNGFEENQDEVVFYAFDSENKNKFSSIYIRDTSNYSGNFETYEEEYNYYHKKYPENYNIVRDDNIKISTNTAEEGVGNDGWFNYSNASVCIYYPEKDIEISADSLRYDTDYNQNLKDLLSIFEF